jgi:hypothetical protein
MGGSKKILTTPSQSLTIQIIEQPPSYYYIAIMTSLHLRLNQENEREQESAFEMIQSRWSLSSQTFVDKPPSQPLSRRQMSENTSSSPETENCHTLPDTGSSRQKFALDRLQRINSKLTSNSVVTADRPPLQPLSSRGSPVIGHQRSSSRWSSGSHVSFDATSLEALVRQPIIVQPSSVSILKHSDTMQNHGEFETTIRTLRILNLSRTHMSLMTTGPSTGLNCTVSPSA